MSQLIQRITPAMLRDEPDQACDIINKIIDKINSIED